VLRTRSQFAKAVSGIPFFVTYSLRYSTLQNTQPYALNNVLRIPADGTEDPCALTFSVFFIWFYGPLGHYLSEYEEMKPDRQFPALIRRVVGQVYGRKVLHEY
jgi:hypothetical protein